MEASLDQLGISTQNDFTFFVIVLLITLIALVATRKLLKVEFPFFFMGVLGVIVGLAVGNLFAKSLDFLPGVYGKWLPVVVQVLVTVAIFDLFMGQSNAVARYFANVFKTGLEANLLSSEILVDTSALIDGRIEELATTGFVFGKLVVPKFVLLELQMIADSKDDLRRLKGRKGLDVLANLQRNRQVIVEIIEDRWKDKDKVDTKLVKLAKERKAKILTVDYNLCQVAQIQSVDVLNLNLLALAVRTQLIPGEEITVKVAQKGKEKHQGVGYLDDGTMVVVESGGKFVGKELTCVVVRIYQTATGKMIFVEPK